MLRRVLLALALGLAVSCAVAQTAPSPADVGISKGSPDVFKLKGHDNAWTPFGSVDPLTHLFIPSTNGNIAPNDCVKWGPGLTSAGAACNSVTGGATPANQLTIYTSHAGLVANVTRPTEAWMVQQQGFYAPGDGGQATYQWSLTSYCPRGTSGAPTAADGVACILPTGQSASTPGRYLLQLGHGIDVRQVGMVGDGVTDNYPLVPALINLLAQGQVNQADIQFPSNINQGYTDYYFSKPFHINRSVKLSCQGIPNGGGDSGTRLVFPAGVNGVVFDNAYTSLDGSFFGAGGMTGCGIVSKGVHLNFTVAGGSNVITVPADKYFNTWDFHVGDGIIPYSGVYGLPITTSPLLVPTGTTVTAVDTGTRKITVSSPVAAQGGGFQLWQLPVDKALTVNTLNGSPVVLVTNAPIRIEAGDYVWSDAFAHGTPVLWNQASSLFTETSTNNFAAGDAFAVGNNAYHFVSPIGSTPGNVLVGANFAASAANLIASIMGTSGSGTTYVPTATASNVSAVIGTWPASATSINFTVNSPYNHYQYAYTTNYVSTYTAAGTPAGSFQAGTFSDQTLTMGAFTLNNYNMTNASKSETGGHLWIIPAAFKTYVGTNLTNNWIGTFPLGLYMECSDWSSAGAGCNGSYAQQNQFLFSMIGRLVVGDNSGASAAMMDVYAENSIADIAELGAVGSNYFAENANSQEDSTAYYGIIGACVNANSSAFWGGYAPTSGGYCANGFDVPTSPGGNVMFFGGIDGDPVGAPRVYNGGFHNRWYFSGNDVGDTAGIQLCMNMPNTVMSFSRDNLSCGGPETWQLGWSNNGYWSWSYFGTAGGTRCG